MKTPTKFPVTPVEIARSEMRKGKSVLLAVVERVGDSYCGVRFEAEDGSVTARRATEREARNIFDGWRHLRLRDGWTEWSGGHPVHHREGKAASRALILLARAHEDVLEGQYGLAMRTLTRAMAALAMADTEATKGGQ